METTLPQTICDISLLSPFLCKVENVLIDLLLVGEAEEVYTVIHFDKLRFGRICE